MLSFLGVKAQKKDQELDSRKMAVIEQRIEFLAELYESEDIDFTTIFEDLSWYYDNPINLNSAEADDLNRLHLLASFQVGAILKYRKQYGDMVTIYELKMVPTMDDETIRQILPFVLVKPAAAKENLDFKRLMKYGKNDLFLRYQRVIEMQDGFLPISDSAYQANPNSRYLGNPDRYYLRYRYRFGDKISFGITAEKDPGEEFFRGSQKQGFDFYSAHLFIRGKGLVRQVALGDYQVEFGQGLVAWSGLAFGKSPMLNTLMRVGQGLRANTSAEENLFMRGAAVTLQEGRIRTTLFGSYKGIDANRIETDTSVSGDNLEISSFQVTGFHRTPRELSNKNAIGEFHGGGHVQIGFEQFKIGVTAIYTAYNGIVNRTLPLYNQFDFNSNQLFNAGIDYTWIHKRYHFFGETGFNAGTGAIANVHGIHIQADSRLQLVGHFRHFPKDYQSRLSNAIAEGSRPQNESGMLIGAQAGLSRKLSLAGYIDHFWSDWLRYRVDAPSTGTDILAQLNYSYSRSTQAYLRIRYKAKELNASGVTEGINFLVPQEKFTIRLHGSFNPEPRLKLRSRVEWVSYQLNNQTPSNGFVLYQDVSWTFTKIPLSITGRYALFQTDTYDSRIYAYENDVLYAFSIPAYYGKGSRVYLMLKYKAAQRVDVWLRVGQFFYTDRDEISTGLNRIDGNSRTEVKAQVRVRF